MPSHPLARDSTRSSHAIELVRGQPEMSDNLEEQGCADLSTTVQRDRDGSAVRMHPPLVAPRLPSFHETQRRRDPLKSREPSH